MTYACKGSVEKYLIVDLKGPEAKTSWLAVNLQSQTNFDSDSEKSVSGQSVIGLSEWDIRLVGELVKEVVVSSPCENLEDGAGNSLGNQRKGKARRWKPLPSSAVKTMTENTSLCVTVICKRQWRII
jgi:hypothetical protein